MEATYFSEKLVDIQRIIKLYIKEDRTFLGISFKIQILQLELNVALYVMFHMHNFVPTDILDQKLF
jgi:hypothetical protein